MAQKNQTSVLYIEDNEDNAYMLSRRLKRRGFNVQVARDGESGVRLALTLKPDIILMDLNLPAMDGWTAAKLLRSNTLTAAVPIIAVSSHVLPDDRETALDAGCTDYETKPIDFERLLVKMQNCLKNERL